jgi:hypothetical protein
VNKIKLYIYPTAKEPIHDSIPGYEDTVPFCRAGRQKWVEPVSESEADFFYYGQVRATDPWPFDLSKFHRIKECPERHIVDLEGDYLAPNFRYEFEGAIVIACGAPLTWKFCYVFPRPTMSQGLVHCARKGVPEYRPPKEHGFGFCGLGNDVRGRMWEALKLAGLPHEVQMNSHWRGPTPVGHADQWPFVKNLDRYSISLCPRGSGIATARFYEACAFGRMPVMIGETLVLGDSTCPIDRFCVRIPDTLSVEALAGRLAFIFGIGEKEILERGRWARDYFEQVVRPYFSDPTRAFLEWLAPKGAV